MLHILLIILKIIGIVLLVILGIILLLLATILFVPIRYRFNGVCDSEVEEDFFIEGAATVIWRPFLVKADVAYKDKALIYRVKVLGSLIFSSVDEKLGWLGRILARKVKQAEKSSDKTSSSKQEDTSPITTTTSLNDELDKLLDEKIDETIHKVEDEVVVDKYQGDGIGKKRDRVKFLDRLRKFVDNIKQVINSIRDAFATAKSIKDKAKIIIDFIKQKRTKKALEAGKKYIFELLRYIRPRRFQGNIMFGFDDPANTGYVLGILGMLIPIYKDNINIVPDFGRQLFKGDMSGKGRIRVVFLLRWVIKIISDKNLMATVKRAGNLLGGE